MKFELYKDRKKEFRWRLIASNGRIVADCAEGYRRKSTMLNSIVLFANAIGKGNFRVGDEVKSAREVVARRRAIFLKASHVPKSKRNYPWGAHTTPDRRRK